MDVPPYKAVIEDECYVVATTENKLLYLDPHICQPYSDVGRDGSDKSYQNVHDGTQRNSIVLQFKSVFSSLYFLDASKAFDRVQSSIL